MITVPQPQSNNDISFDSLPSIAIGGVALHQPISDVTVDIFLPTEAEAEAEAITMSNSPSTSTSTSKFEINRAMEQYYNISFYLDIDSFPFIGNVAHHDPISVGADDNLMPTEASSVGAKTVDGGWLSRLRCV